MSWETVSPTDRPMKTSAPRMASAQASFQVAWIGDIQHLRLDGSEVGAVAVNNALAVHQYDVPGAVIHQQFGEAIPPAPAPEKTNLASAMGLPTTCRALMMEASTTMDVPCWSSWKTGMPRSWRLSSISKQRGAAMSSR